MANTIVFIDSHIPDNEYLMLTRSSAIEYRILDKHRDGIEQMVDALAGQNGYDSIQIISHGAPGSITIGDTVLDHNSLSQYADQLATLGKALTTDGDLLLYGCNVGEGDDGHAFIAALAHITGADVAASDDLTGSATKGGDWTLEVHNGTIENIVLPMTGFNGVLGNTAPTFISGNGKVTTDFGGFDDARSVTVQSDGKILLAGSSGDDFALARYNSEGSLDTTLSSDGKLTTDFGGSDFGNSVALQPDGKILLAGSSNGNFAVVRYNPNGSLDTSFGFNGRVTTDFGSLEDYGYSVTVQSDGKILLAGSSDGDFALARYSSDGSLDTTFSSYGKFTTDFGGSDYGYSVVLQPDGKILLAGTSSCDFALARYNTDGSLDTSFNDDGKLTTDFGDYDFGYSVTVQPDGKILVTGSSNSDFALARYNSDGSLDTTLSSDGKLTTDFGGYDSGYSVTVQPDGKILVAGLTGFGNGDFDVARYNSNGALDSTFGSDGKVTTDFGGGWDGCYSLALLSDGRILVAGLSGDDFALARYNSDGSLDTTFHTCNTRHGAPTYIEHGSAVVLDNIVQIFDAELAASNNYAGASLTLTRHDGTNANDLFSGAGIVVAAASGAVTIDDTDIGIYTWTAGTLTLSFNNNATKALVNHAMQSLAYEYASDAPPSSVQIDWTFNDGDNSGALSTIGSTLVAIDKLPTFTDFTYPVATTAEDHAVKISFSDLLAHSNATDVDGTVESFTVKGITSGTLTIGSDASTATVWVAAINNAIDATHDAWWTPESNANGTFVTFEVVAYDNDGAESIIAIPVTVTVSSENDAPTFINSDGKVTTDFGSSDYGNSVTVQADGKILLAGSSDGDFAAVRYNSDGSLDTTFGSDGIVTTDFGGSDYSSSITVQPDSKILLAGLGNGNFVLARYNSDGSLDTSFDYDGKLATDLGEYDYGHSIALQPDGKILVVGSNDNFTLARYKSDGTLDTSFGYDGKLTIDFGGGDHGNNVTVQADGKILVAGRSYDFLPDFALARYRSDGSLDTSFGYDGKLTTDFGLVDYAYIVAIQPDGKILVGGNTSMGSSSGHSYSAFVLARYNSDGSLDTSFDYDGKLTTDFGGNVTVQTDGKILVADTSAQVINSDFPVARYNSNGSLDTSFNYDGKLATDFGNSIAVQPDGKILVAGTSAQGINSNFAVARYNSDGSLDTRFNAFNTLNGAPTYLKNGRAVVLDRDVKLFDAELSASNNYAGASLTLARHSGANADDLFSDAGIVAAAASGDVTIDSINIATCTWSAGTLALVFNNNATQALVNHAMQSLVYENASDAPPSSVQIDWTFNDGDSSGALSTIGSTLVTIVTDPVATTEEDRPVKISFSDLFAYRNGSEVDGAVESFTVKTINSGALTIGRDASTATAWDAATNHTIDATHYAWWRPNHNANGMLDAFTVVAHHNDGEESITTTPAIVNVASVNDAPTFIPCNGKVTTDFGSNDDGNSVAVQADGKILLAGSSGDDFALARYNSDGSLDTTFGSNGKLATDFGGVDYGYSVTVQPDGKILLAGQHFHNDSVYNIDLAVSRYNSDGSLDATFGSNGKLATAVANYGSITSVTAQPDGKILVASTSEGVSAVARYNSDGSLDTTIGDFGLQNYGKSVTLQPDGQILVTGVSYSYNRYTYTNNIYFFLARFHSDGSLDIRLTTDFAVDSVAVQADGKILVAGSSDGDFALARYNSDGSIDTSFSSDGKLVTDFAGSDDHGSSVTVQLDGKILVAGSSDGDFALARYNSDGLLDTSFSYDGRDTTNFGGSDDSCNNVTMQADGKILVTGSSGGDFAVARYNSDGSLDTTFNGFNTLNGAPTYIKHGNAVVLDNDVQIFDAELAASNNYAGASLTLARHGGASADDRFSGPGIVAAASGTGGIVTVDGTDIGTYTWSAGTLTLVFNNNATQALVNHAMQSLAYENASDAPPSSVQIDWTFNDGDRSGALSTTGSTMVQITNGQVGIAQDGYLAHTLVWVDSNNNGVRDWADTNSNGLWDSGEGEAWTQTDSTGQFSSLPDNGTLRIAANPAGGSTDISTGLPFTGTFSAPSGSTVINPLTTLLVAAGGDATSVNKALGLDIALDLATYDPLAILSASGASSGDQAQALAIQCKAIQIANIMDIAISAAHGAGATNANMSDMTTRIAASLLADAGTGAVNLDNSAVIANAMTSAAQTVVSDTTALNAQKTAIADATALINSKIGTASSGSDLFSSITNMVAAQIVAQETLATQASQAIQNNSSASLTLDSGNIDSAVSAAISQVGVIHPPTITNFSPLDGATNVPVDSDLHFTFSDAIQGGTGLIEIHRDSATGPVVESYDPLHNGNLSLSGNVLTVNPTNNLDHNTHYYVTFAQSSIDNLFGDHFIGSTDYDLFTVADPYAESDGNGDSTPTVLLGIGGLAPLAWVLL